MATAAGSAMTVVSSDLQQRHCGRTPAVELYGAAAMEQLINVWRTASYHLGTPRWFVVVAGVNDRRATGRRLRLVRMVDVRQSKGEQRRREYNTGQLLLPADPYLSLPLEQTASDVETPTMATPAVTGFTYYSGDEQQSSVVATAAGSALAVVSSDLQQRHCGRTPAVELCGAAALEQLING
nr:hypothetical protein Itr_chr10CG15300 [Ipomoea trifida]